MRKDCGVGLCRQNRGEEEGKNNNRKLAFYRINSTEAFWNDFKFNLWFSTREMFASASVLQLGWCFDINTTLVVCVGECVFFVQTYVTATILACAKELDAKTNNRWWSRKIAVDPWVHIHTQPSTLPLFPFHRLLLPLFVAECSLQTQCKWDWAYQK